MAVRISSFVLLEIFKTLQICPHKDGNSKRGKNDQIDARKLAEWTTKGQRFFLELGRDNGMGYSPRPDRSIGKAVTQDDGGEI